MGAHFFIDTAGNSAHSFLKELQDQIHVLTLPEKEEFEERAAIMEYEGQLSREEAEWRALRIIQENRIKIAV
jgi:hypothetical protein